VKQYEKMVKDILETGVQKRDRTGTGTISLFAYQARFNLQDGFPCLTTKKMHLRSIIYELLWFLKGDTNIKYLNDNGVTIWDEWASADGDLGPIYGKQWRRWKHVFIDKIARRKNRKSYKHTIETIDQIAQVIEALKTNPNDRRMIVSAWNPGEAKDMKLPPCHLLFQFWSRELSKQEKYDLIYERFPKFINNGIDRTTNLMKKGPQRALSCQLYQRSCDVGLGVPFNIASYALLTMMVAQVVNMVPEEFIWVGGDIHIYNNHIDKLKKQIKRKPFALPKMIINNRGQSIDDFVYEDFELRDYECHPGIKLDISV